MMNRKGFTLIELLIVVVIIGILAAIAIPKFASTKEKAYLASMKSDLRNLATSQEGYFADNQKYLVAGAGSNLAGAPSPIVALGNWVPSAGVTVTLEAAGANGWGADAIHSGTSKKCFIFLNHTGPNGVATVEGEPKCDP
jgi:type IV pilus assembly protein PilA